MEDSAGASKVCASSSLFFSFLILILVSIVTPTTPLLILFCFPVVLLVLREILTWLLRGRLLTSLLVTTDDMYTSHLHGIRPVAADEAINSASIANWDLLGNREAFAAGRYDRRLRTSLTYRDVLKVSNAASRLFGRR